MRFRKAALYLHQLFNTYNTSFLMARTTNNNVRTAAQGMRVMASFISTTLNREKRTVDVVFATDTPVIMGYYDRYYEILSFGEGHCDLSRLNNGAPLLDNHNRWTNAADLPGVVERAWVQDGKGYATIRFSNDAGKDGQRDGPGQRLMDRVEEGIVRNVSVGYTVSKYEEVDSAGSQTAGVAGENKIPTYRAMAWQPYEVSLVTIPADYTAGVRGFGAGDNQTPAIEIETIFLNNQTDEQAMKVRRMQFNAGGAGEGGGGGAAPAAAAAAPPAGEGHERGGSAPPAGGGAAPAAAAPAAEPPAAGGTERSLEIMQLCHLAGLSMARAMEFAGGTQTIAQVRSALIKERETATDTTAPGGNNRGAVSNDEADKVRTGLSDALLTRAMPGIHKPTELGASFRSYGLLDMARMSVIRASGGRDNTGNMSHREIAEAALNLNRASGMLSTSDFPILLGNTIGRVLRSAYESRVSEWRKFCRQSNAKDFREKTTVQMSEMGSFDKIKEGGEYKYKNFSEAQEKYRVEKYGAAIGVTWETIINDDLGFLNRIPGGIAEMAIRKQDDIVYDILNSNPLMGDGYALFSAQHANLATGAAISIASLTAARKLMRLQKGIAGNQYLNLTPKYLVVGPDLEQIALQFMSTTGIFPTSPTEKNIWAGTLEIIVEPRITGNKWFLIANPSSIDTIEYAFLEGEGELFTSMREGWDVDGMEMKARMVFAAKAIDAKGFVYNPGA